MGGNEFFEKILKIFEKPGSRQSPAALPDPRKTRVRSRKLYWVADGSPQKALTALAVKL